MLHKCHTTRTFTRTPVSSHQSSSDVLLVQYASHGVIDIRLLSKRPILQCPHSESVGGIDVPLIPGFIVTTTRLNHNRIHNRVFNSVLLSEVRMPLASHVDI
jgi:hypothetical protein